MSVGKTGPDPSVSTDILIDEVAVLVGTDLPERIAARLGMPYQALTQALSRAGRNDLAAALRRTEPAPVPKGPNT